VRSDYPLRVTRSLTDAALETLKNRNRLLKGEIAAKFLAAVLAHSKVKRPLSSEHFCLPKKSPCRPRPAVNRSQNLIEVVAALWSPDTRPR